MRDDRVRSGLLALVPRWRLGATERGEAGQSLVEFALAVPIVAFVLLGGVDLSRGYAVQVALQNAARSGAEAALLGTAATDGKIAEYVRTELGGVPGVDTSNATVIISRTTESGTCFVTIRVWYTHRTLVTWPGIPTSARIDRTTKLRDFRPVPSGGDADNSEDSQDSQDSGGSESGNGTPTGGQTGSGGGTGSGSGSGSGQTNASNATDCDDSGGSDTASGSQDDSGGTPTQGTNTEDSDD